ncbi:50S ribosomal protein L29 [Candidatus Woesearchaeota archaeon]|nr:50S ribosomal protein L29 [Candidatus Woesearchaeota archaeon]
MKKKDKTPTSPEEAQQKIKELRKEIMKQRAQISLGTAPKSSGQLQQSKRMIARLLTSVRAQQGGTKRQ